ncbi:hypothetical protein A5722_14870 [Mycobacterium vulneris]|nr:hypothetical protein A5722_14870 [Mycolicibacterium vulneris]OCB66211.1 hypothetical protein A5729_12375 [Mycolicibacterium vulneris]
MPPKTTTGIVLIRDNRSLVWSLTRRPGQPAKRYEADTTLTEITMLAGLVDGYWLRSTPTPTATTWTWVQL